MNELGNLMICRTSREILKKGITIVRKADGVWITDQHGKRYLDFVAGVTRCVHVGYGNREIADAAYKQLIEMPYFTPMQFANTAAIRLSNKLAEITPKQINNFHFVCDGSEAVESAIKLAKHYHYFLGDERRNKVISRKGAYHGTTGGALSVLGTALQMRHMMEPLSSRSVFVESPYCYRCPYHLSYPNCEILCATEIERVIQFEDPKQISAFIGEPIQQGFGAYAPPKEYWPLVRKICDDYGILLIIDEVICGFGRTGKWFGIQHYDIKPDIITMAKGISSGYLPLGGIGFTDEVANAIEIFEHLHTYANHPVSCAGALKNVEILQRENLVQRAKEIGIYFSNELKILESHPIVGEVRATGLWAAIDFTTDKKTKAPFPISRLENLVKRAMRKGLVIKFMGQAIELAPSFIIQENEIDEGIKILDDVIAKEEKEMGIR